MQWLGDHSSSNRVTTRTLRHVGEDRPRHFALLVQTPVQYPDRGIGGSHFDVLGHQRLCDRMRSVNCFKLEDDFADVMIDGLDTDLEFDGNLPVDFAQGELAQYLYLARCQPEALESCIKNFNDFIA